MGQLLKGETFTDIAPGKTVTSGRMNNLVDGAVLLNGAVLDQTEKATPLDVDFVLLGDSTLAASAAPKKAQVVNLQREAWRDGTQQYVATDTGAANAYVVSLPIAPTAYAAGQVVRFKASNANTLASTINVNGKGVKTIKTRAGTDLAANDILAGQVVTLVYDGTYFQLVTALSANQVTATQVTENLRGQAAVYASDTGAANACACAPSPAYTAYVVGMTVRFKAAATNTGACTLNVNALGAKTIKTVIAGAVADLKANDIQANDLVTAVYDGTYFQLTGRVRSWDYVSANTNAPAASAKVDFAHGLGAIPTKVRVMLVQTNATAQNGYAQNDETELVGIGNSNGRPIFQVSADATNVTVSRSNDSNAYQIPKAGGGVADQNSAINTPNFYWKLKVYASL